MSSPTTTTLDRSSTWLRRRRQIAILTVISYVVALAWVPAVHATQTGTWTGDVTGAETTSGGGVTTVTGTINSPTPWLPTTINRALSQPPGGPNPYTPASMLGDNAWQVTVPPETDAGTITFTFSNPVVNPIISVDRIGGQVGGNTSNSARFTLMSPGSLTKLSGVNHLNVGTVGGDWMFERTPNQNVSPGGDCTNASTGTGANTACGSIQVNGVFTEITFAVGMVGQVGAGDALHFAWYWEQDLGDAPESYGRAIHAISNPAGTLAPEGPFLGALRPTDDPDGNEFHPTADRDANDDGVAGFPIVDPLMAGQTFTVPVEIGASGVTGEVCGWIDWNQNGAFDSGEQVCAPAPSGSTVDLEWTVPSGLSGGDEIFARFRIASDGSEAASPTGAASDGEVEDYMFTITPLPEIDLVKQADTDELVAGETITYFFTATNTGNITVNDVTITDTGFSGSGALSPLACIPSQPVDLDPGEEVVCEATYTVTQADVNAGSIVNTAEAMGTSAITGSQVIEEDDEVVTADQDPSVSFEKTSDVASVNAAGDVIEYTFLATNTGNVTLTDVEISDDLDGLSGLVCDPTQPTTIQPGDILECTATYTVTQTDIDNGGVTNTAIVTGNDPNDEPIEEEDTDEVPADQNPGMALEKTSDVAEVDQPGDVIEYTFTATNTGNVTLTNVEIGDDLAGLSALVCDPEQPTTLAPGAALECTATYEVTQEDIDSGGVQNSATVTGNDPNDNPIEEEDDHDVPADQNPDITLVKSADPLGTLPDAGENIEYTFVATNTGNVTLTDVGITDDLDGLSPLVCGPTAGSTLEPGEQMICTATYEVTQDDVDNGFVDNTATATGTDPNDDPVTDDDSVTVPAEQEPGISFVKTSDVTEVNEAGDVIEYTFTATNTGNVTLTDVTITDDLDGLSVLVCDPAQPATLAPGVIMECTATYEVTQADIDNGSVSNSATVTGNDPSDDPVEEEDDNNVPSNQNPGMEFEKTSDVTEINQAGDIIEYTFLATNTGNVTLTNVTITDDLDGLSTLDCDPAQPATLAPGDTLECTATYTVTQTDIDNGEVTNSAIVTGNDPNDNPIEEEDDNNVPANQEPGIEFEKTSDVTEVGQAGDTIEYTFTATNTGNVTLTNVEITDDLDGLSALVCDPTQPATLQPGDILECTATYTVTQTDIDNGGVTNSATVTGNDPNDNPIDEEDTDDVPSNQNPGIGFEKTSDVASVNAAGDVIEYTFTAVNTGNVTLTDVEISDDLPGLSALVCDPEQPTTLLPGDILECTATYEVTQADVDNGGVQNSATVTGNDPNDNPIEEEDDHDVPADLNPGFAFEKTSDEAEVNDAGDVIEYTFTATNTGNVTLTDVEIGDDLAGLSALVCDPEQPTTLLPGDILECTATYEVTQADIDNGGVQNSATVTGNDPNDDPVEEEDDHDVPAIQDPDITLVKSADPLGALPDAGENIEFTFVATNTGNVTLTNVTITDNLAGLSPLACDPGAGATLEPTEQMICTATYEVTQDDVDNGFVENNATATGTDPNDNPVTDDDSVSVPAIQEPGISFEKTSDVTEINQAGDIIEYTFTATNTGNVTLTNVEITDNLPGLSPLVCDPEQPTSLAPSAMLECTATYTVTQADIDNGSVANSATVTGNDPNDDPVEEEDDHDVPANQNPGMEFEKTSDITEVNQAGDIIEYTFLATNTGNVTLTDVEIGDDLAGLSALVCDPEQPTTLLPGDTLECTATYEVTQADIDNGSVSNSATVTGNDPNDNPIEEEDTNEVPSNQNPGMEFEKTSDVTEVNLAGDIIEYTFTATNTGNVTLTNIEIIDNLDGLSGLVCDPTQPATLAPEDTLECTATYTVTQTDIDNGGVTNTATVTGNDPNDNPIDEEDTNEVPSNQNPGIGFEKTSDVASVNAAGDVIEYTFTATNTGNVTLTEVEITDDLDGLSGLVCDPTQPATLAPEDTLECTATYTVTQTDIDNGGVTNTATVTGNDPNDNPIEEEDSEDVEAPADPSIALAKSVSPSAEMPEPGEEITYGFVALNTGNVTLTNVEITDNLDGLSPLFCDPDQPATLSPGAILECTATYTVTQADVDRGTIENTATVTAVDPNGTEVEDTDSAELPGEIEPGLALTKTADVTSVTTPGDVINYAFVATNTGNVTLTNVAVTDDLDGLSALVCDPDASATLIPGQTMTCTASYQVTQADIDAGGVENTATASGTDPDGGTTTSEDSEDVPAIQAPGIELDKTSNASQAQVGDVITYTFVATNTGNVTLTDIVLDDPMINGNGPLCEWESIAPGESVSCTSTYVIATSDSGDDLVNHATLTASNLGGIVAEVSAEDTATLEVLATATSPLPFTGFGLFPLILAGLTALGVGLVVRRAGSRMD